MLERTIWRTARRIVLEITLLGCVGWSNRLPGAEGGQSSKLMRADFFLPNFLPKPEKAKAGFLRLSVSL